MGSPLVPVQHSSFPDDFSTLPVRNAFMRGLAVSVDTRFHPNYLIQHAFKAGQAQKWAMVYYIPDATDKTLIAGKEFEMYDRYTGETLLTLMWMVEQTNGECLSIQPFEKNSPEHPDMYEINPYEKPNSSSKIIMVLFPLNMFPIPDGSKNV